MFCGLIIFIAFLMMIFAWQGSWKRFLSAAIVLCILFTIGILYLRSWQNVIRRVNNAVPTTAPATNAVIERPTSATSDRFKTRHN